MCVCVCVCVFVRINFECQVSWKIGEKRFNFAEPPHKKPRRSAICMKHSRSFEMCMRMNYKTS